MYCGELAAGVGLGGIGKKRVGDGEVKSDAT
jgi:hypothetical protein